jgi:anthraniloyl-CoA monooxygenase
MRIACIGGGPAGLYLAILMKQADPAHDITVYERNRPDDTFGWGVVFSDATLGNFQVADPESYEEITRNFHHWDDCDVFFKGRRITSGGHGYCGIGRQKLLNILQGRAATLGVRQVFEAEVADDDDPRLAGADLIVAADGVNSKVRNKYASHFQPDIDVRKCRYIWLGTHLKLNAFTFITEPSEWGWFQVHAYQFDRDTSTFIVECREETWLAAGLDKLDQAGSIAFCEKLFAKHLQGNRLMSNARHLRGSAWLNFNRVLCRKWHHRNIVLIGDAAHTAHFSIGSGTKLAMEDAIALSKTLTANPGNVERALALYQEEREIEALKLQSSARNRMEWFENVARYAHLEPEQFAYTLLTGSQRIGHENLRLRDKSYVDSVETWFARQVRPAGAAAAADVHPLHAARPHAEEPRRRLADGDVFLSRRQAVRLPAGALRRARPGRRRPGDDRDDLRRPGRPHHAGLRRPVERGATAQGWQRIVDFVHQHATPASACSSAMPGRRARPSSAGRADRRTAGRGQLAAARRPAIPYGPQNQVPKAMTRADMDVVREQFVAAARRGAAAGFDLLELHCAHGYLLSSFLCPLTNRARTNTAAHLANRLRFPLEVCRALRPAWPQTQADGRAHFRPRLGAGRQHGRGRRRHGTRLP